MAHVTLEQVIDRAEKMGEDMTSDIADSVNRHGDKFDQDGRQMVGSADVIAAAFILISAGANYLAAVTGSDTPIDIIKEARDRIITRLITTPEMSAASVTSLAFN